MPETLSLSLVRHHRNYSSPSIYMVDVFWSLNKIASKLIVLSEPPASSYMYEG